MRSADAIVIDPAACTGCGACVRTCPSGAIALEGGKARVTGTVSLHCGHCAAACPASAVRVTTLGGEATAFATFAVDPAWVPHGGHDAGGLVRLMGSRRSCRRYASDPVPAGLLEDLVKAGILAPSGTNSQRWAFTIVPARRDMEAFGRRVADFYRRLDALAGWAVLRWALRLVGQRELQTYWNEYHEAVKTALEEYDRKGRDLLFHGATCAIVVSSRPGASCPADDALLATQNILLAAHALGLGSCLVGFAVKAMERDGSIQRTLGIPADETVHSVIALGRPDERFARIAGRMVPPVRYFRS